MLHTKGEVAKSLGNQARGLQPACTMTTQNSKITPPPRFAFVPPRFPHQISTNIHALRVKYYNPLCMRWGLIMLP